MKIKAQIINVENVSGTSKKDQKPYNFNVVKFLDTEAKTTDLLSCMIPDVLLSEVHAIKGKVHLIACSLVNGRLNLDAVQPA